MKCFFNEHPIVTLLIVSTLCETAVVVTKIIKGDCYDISLFNFNSNPNNSDTTKVDNSEIKKEG